MFVLRCALLEDMGYLAKDVSEVNVDRSRQYPHRGTDGSIAPWS